jgi:hypothetical protein
MPAWRPMVAFAAMLVVAITTVVWRGTAPNVRRMPATTAGVSATAEPSTDDLMAPDESLDFMVNLASNLSFEELQDVAQPTADVTAAALDQLTSAQRARLARLIAAEMGGSGEN